MSGGKAIYPGSFDPITYGHLDILQRATEMFDKVVLTVAVNTQKKYVFEADERLKLIQACIENEPWAHKVEIDQFTGLLVDYCSQKGIYTLIRGVRQISDFEYEFRMALMNRRLNNKVDTVFLMPDEELTFVSATMVREVAYWGGELNHFVPKVVADELKKKYAKKDD
ncbi:pantetheine-phosphate adenylyltransferase [bacterium]|nr:MAG: pantetheine-phosphate adenylyltransferase [bacterium]